MIVYLYFKDKKNIENCENMYFSCNILVSFSFKKNVCGYPYLNPHNSIIQMLY
jgi:hypothetical protein